MGSASSQRTFQRWQILNELFDEFDQVKLLVLMTSHQSYVTANL